MVACERWRVRIKPLEIPVCNVGVHACSSPLGKCQSGLAGLCWKGAFSVARSRRAVSQSGWRWHRAPANSWEGPSGPRPRQHSAPSASWASAVLVAPWRHSVVLICISLMEHLLMDLLSVSISFLVRCLLGSLDHFISSVCSFPYYREDNLKRLGSVSFQFCDVMQKAKPWT